MMSRLTPLVIVGAGGFGREVLGLVRDINSAAPTFDFLGFMDDGEINAHLLQRLGATLLGPASRLADFAASYVVGIGATEPRRRIEAVARSLGRTAAVLKHPSATIGSDVQIGDGAIVAAGARLTTNIVIGRHAHINLNSTIGHDAIVEDLPRSTSECTWAEVLSSRRVRHSALGASSCPTCGLATELSWGPGQWSYGTWSRTLRWSGPWLV